MTAGGDDVTGGLRAGSSGGILEITICRSERRNALTVEMIQSLTSSLDAAATDESVRAILLDGEGDHFCSGFDLASGRRPDRPARTGATQRMMRASVNRLVPTLLEIPTPVVVAVRGWAAGLGLALVLAADFAVVADDARLWAPFTGLGFSADSGTSWLVPRLVGVARAKEMLMLGRKVTGAEAAAWGAVTRAVPADRVTDEARSLAGELARSASVAVGLTKDLVHRSATNSIEQQLADEAMSVELSARTDDFRAAARARRDGTNVEFQGR
jgi:2-(1,2-epoxy-1,2-dihydrophenyl)acetyl-CoA isomerase